MAIDLTTSARVKARQSMDANDDTRDGLITAFISGVSREAERLLNRETEATSRTVYLDVCPGQRLFWLRGVPVTTVTSVHYDVDRAFAATSLLATSEYWVNPSDTTGELTLDYGLDTPGRGVLKVVYTGGMATDATAFVAAFPDIADAIDRQVAYMLMRKNSLGVSSEAMGGSNSTHFEMGQWLPDVRSVLLANRREVISV